MTNPADGETPRCVFCDRQLFALNRVIWVTDLDNRQTRWCDDEDDGTPRHHRAANSYPWEHR